MIRCVTLKYKCQILFPIRRDIFSMQFDICSSFICCAMKEPQFGAFFAVQFFSLSQPLIFHRFSRSSYAEHYSPVRKCPLSSSGNSVLKDIPKKGISFIRTMPINTQYVNLTCLIHVKGIISLAGICILSIVFKVRLENLSISHQIIAYTEANLHYFRKKKRTNFYRHACFSTIFFQASQTSMMRLNRFRINDWLKLNSVRFSTLVEFRREFKTKYVAMLACVSTKR